MRRYCAWISLFNIAQEISLLQTGSMAVTLFCSWNLIKTRSNCAWRDNTRSKPQVPVTPAASQSQITFHLSHYNSSSYCFIGWETWSLTLSDDHRLSVFVNRILRRTFGSKRVEHSSLFISISAIFLLLLFLLIIILN